ncbi:hypothetical protein RA210_U30343 [Rubrivivax sp. A210]|uniref:hypothetical protein n=1 Tax=Rubrivivax sp. A210 TaxID=2772301 RepID=UPI00191A97E9|nr:hypothetical protein [Rubrivivax sp. A210]CAD5373431.1 hypothetical protein RA210_U30343 [Rubrivivax sp. A210]
MKNLTTEQIETCESDPDASFASIHLDIQRTYLAVHTMMNAIFCCRLALASDLSREQRLSLFCAALTHRPELRRLYRLDRLPLAAPGAAQHQRSGVRRA